MFFHGWMVLLKSTDGLQNRGECMAWVKPTLTVNSENFTELKQSYCNTGVFGQTEYFTDYLESLGGIPSEFNDAHSAGDKFLWFETPTRKVYLIVTTSTSWGANPVGTVYYANVEIRDMRDVLVLGITGNPVEWVRTNNANTGWTYTSRCSIMVDTEGQRCLLYTFRCWYDRWRTPPRVTQNLVKQVKTSGMNEHDLYVALDIGGIPETDPYAPNGYAGTGGGFGTFDTTSDVIAIPNAPTLSVVNSGFVSLYNPTQTQLANLASYMWDNSFLTSLVKLRANPLDVIVSLTMLPCDIPSTTPVNMVIGNVDTLIAMNRASSQYVDVSCGNLTIPHFYDSYLDYEPFTKAELYLPYIGVQTLSMDDIVGKTLSVLYRVDILTGACICYVTVDGNVMYTYSGQCGVSVPLSGESFNTTLSVLGTVTAGTVAIASSPTAVTVASNVLQGGNNVATMKPSFTRSGSISSNIGVLGVQKPYIIYTVPNVSLPENNNKFFGYPLNMTTTLDELTGFTVVDEIRLDGLEVSEEERDRLREILKGGVVI